VGGRRYRSPTVKEMERGESQLRFARVVAVDACDGREDIRRLMIMRDLAIVISVTRQFVTVVINRDFVGVSIMVDVFHHCDDRLIMSRLMRPPHHTRHDKRAYDQDKGEVADHTVLLSATALEGNMSANWTTIYDRFWGTRNERRMAGIRVQRCPCTGSGSRHPGLAQVR
jgi:hypothetical protein